MSRGAMTRSFVPFVCAAAVAYAALGCSAADPTRTVQVEGELGNGGFLFLCDDSVQCEKTASDVSRFPKSIAVGATFNVRYKLDKDPALIKITLDNAAQDKGITVQPAVVAPTSVSATKYQYISRGPAGFLGLKVGFATLVARDRKGFVVDYLTVKLQQPDAVAVYKAEDRNSPPPRVTTVQLTEGDTASLRAVAQKAGQDLGGALQVEWISDTPDVVSVDGRSGVKVTLTAKKAGTATLTATAGGFENKIAVEVKP